MKNLLGLYVRSHLLGQHRTIIEGIVISKNAHSIMVVDTDNEHYLCSFDAFIIPDDYLAMDELKFVKRMRSSVDGLAERMSKK